MKRTLAVAASLSMFLALTLIGCEKSNPLTPASPRMTTAPNVPDPVHRRNPAVIPIYLETKEVQGVLMPGSPQDTRYTFWTFNGHVPGPFIRVRVGDTIEVTLHNDAQSTMPHNVDLHAVTGPGGGSTLLTAAPGEEKVARFRLLNPGLFVYHCAMPPMTAHIANGMYGLILVEPEGGLPKVDREFYVMQSEFYTKGPFGAAGLQAFDPQKATDENPTYVVFNGFVGALQGSGALQARAGETVRIFFGNAGPNFASCWHMVGAVMGRLYREGSVTHYDESVQTTLVPAGGAAIAEFKMPVPGDYTLLDHSMSHMDKGAAGTLHISGDPRPDIYQSVR